MQICFATNNRHKIEEATHVIGDRLKLLSLQDIGCTEELPETRDTLEGNALQKAEYVFNNFSTPCFADDTGLEVPSLGGAPGVYSARYAGPQRNSEDNTKLLLKNPQVHQKRNARFRTIIVLIGVELNPVYFEGIIEGEIAHE